MPSLDSSSNRDLGGWCRRGGGRRGGGTFGRDDSGAAIAVLVGRSMKTW